MPPAAATKPKPAAHKIQLPGDPVAGARRIRIDTPGSKIPITKHVAGRRRILTPGTVVLAALMVFFGMYATGNLPQFDRWTNSLVATTQAKNDVVVGSIEDTWKYIVGAIAVAFFGLIALLVRNHRRTKHNADGEFDFNTR